MSTSKTYTSNTNPLITNQIPQIKKNPYLPLRSLIFDRLENKPLTPQKKTKKKSQTLHKQQSYTTDMEKKKTKLEKTHEDSLLRSDFSPTFRKKKKKKKRKLHRPDAEARVNRVPRTEAGWFGGMYWSYYSLLNADEKNLPRRRWFEWF